MLPASFPSHRSEVAAELHVHASDDRQMADATAMVVDRTPYMLSASTTNAAESDEKNVEMFLVHGLVDHKRHIPITRPLESHMHQDTGAHTGRTDSTVDVARSGPSTSDISIKTLQGRAPETLTQGDTSDGLFLLKRSAHYTPRLSVNTLSTSETTQLKRDIALWRMAKSSSPPVEPRLSQLSPPSPARSPIYHRPAHTPPIPSTVSESLSSAEEPKEPTSLVCPDIIPPTDFMASSSEIPAAIETAVVEDVAMSIVSSNLPHVTVLCHAQSASVAQPTPTILHSDPADEELSIATGTAVPISSTAADGLVDISDSSLCPAPTETTPADLVGSLVDAPDCAALITPFDLPHDTLIPQSTDGLEATFYLAALDTTVIEELDCALVSLRPATPTPCSVEEAQPAEDTLETECSLPEETPLLTDDYPAVSTDTHEPCYADAQCSTLSTSPPGSISLLAPVIEAASVEENIGIADGDDHTFTDSPASSTPLPELSYHAEQDLDSTSPVDKVEPTAEDVAQQDVTFIVCAPSATQAGLTSPEEIEVEHPITADVLVPIPTPEASLHGVEVLVPIPPVILSSSVLPLCAAPSEAEVVSQAPQSRECSPIPDTKMEVEAETTHLVASDDSATLLPVDPSEYVVMEVDPMRLDDLDVAETTTIAEDIPEFADAYLDLPPSSPPASSSPPYIFSSSPPRDFDVTPPSSSPPTVDVRQCYLEEPETRKSAEDTNNDSLIRADHGSLKRSAPSLDGSEVTLEEEKSTKRVKIESLAMPTESPQPKRLTQASVAKQHKKLAAPFRSPVIKGPLVQGGLHAVYATGRALMPPPLRKAAADDATIISPHETANVRSDPTSSNKDPSARPDPNSANKDRTVNAAKQFKSPLVGSSAAAPTSGTLFSSAKATPTIQALQGKLQTLKQAIRIRNSGKEDQGDELERLVTKWTTAGREVAWAVWDYVKDLDPGTDAAAGQSKGGWSSDGGDFWGAKTGEKRGFEPGWGYDDEHASKKARTDGGVEEATEEEEEAPPAMQHTLGTMLRHMSIDPATLGWDEEEGDFVDV